MSKAGCVNAYFVFVVIVEKQKQQNIVSQDVLKCSRVCNGLISSKILFVCFCWGKKPRAHLLK